MCGVVPHGHENNGQVISDREFVVELVAAPSGLYGHVEVDETGREVVYGLFVVQNLLVEPNPKKIVYTCSPICK